MASKKQINAQATQVTALAKESPYLVAAVTLLDKSGQVDVEHADLVKVAAKVAGNVPATSFVLISAGKTKCTALAKRGEGSEVDLKKWIEAGGLKVEEVESEICGTLEAEFPIKKKDECISAMFGFLRKEKLLEEESSDDEVFGLPSDDEA